MDRRWTDLEGVGDCLVRPTGTVVADIRFQEHACPQQLVCGTSSLIDHRLQCLPLLRCQPNHVLGFLAHVTAPSQSEKGKKHLNRCRKTCQLRSGGPLVKG